MYRHYSEDQLVRRRNRLINEIEERLEEGSDIEKTSGPIALRKQKEAINDLKKALFSILMVLHERDSDVYPDPRERKVTFSDFSELPL